MNRARTERLCAELTRYARDISADVKPLMRMIDGWISADVAAAVSIAEDDAFERGYAACERRHLELL